MDRKEVLDTLRRNMPILEERFGVTELALFGSFARDQATEESDVDIIVKFNARPHWKTYFGAQFYLEDLLGRPVDMSTMRELRSEILPYVERDTINVLRPERYPLLAFLHRRYLEFGEKVLSYTDGLDEAAFIADGLTYDATMRNIQLIGESATHIPSEVREEHPDIPWSAIIGTRNRLVHGYRQVDQAVLWSIIQDAIPTLLPQLQQLLEDLQRE